MFPIIKSMQKRQAAYNKKLDELTTAKALALPVESKPIVYEPEDLVIAGTDTEYDGPLPKKVTVAAPGVAKQQVGTTGGGPPFKKGEGEGEDEVEGVEGVKNNSDQRILGAIAAVVALSFFMSGEKALSKTTLTTLMAMGVVGAVVVASTRTPGVPATKHNPSIETIEI